MSWRARAAQMFKRQEKPKAEDVPPKAHGAHGALFSFWFFVAIGSMALAASTWMLLVFVAGAVGHVDWTWDYRSASSGEQRNEWAVESSIHVLVAIGLFLFCAAIAVFNAIWVEVQRTLVQPLRGVVIALGTAVALFMISGSVVVQQKGTDAKARDAVIEANSAKVGVAAVAGEIAAVNADLTALTAPDDDTPTTQQMAARAGEVAWRERIAEAERQQAPQLDSIRRALSDARAADRLRAKRAELERTKAVASTSQVVAESVTVTASTPMAQAVVLLEDLRKPITAILGELLAMVAFALAMSSWRAHKDAQARLAGAAEAPTVEPMGRGFQIEDHSNEAPIQPDPEGSNKGITDAVFEDLTEKYKERARKAAETRRRNRDERGVQSPSDERFGAPIIATPAPAPVEAVEVDVQEVPPPEAPPIEQEDAMKLVEEGRAELVEDDEGRQFIRMLEEYGPPAPARAETELADGKGVMVH